MLTIGQLDIPALTKPCTDVAQLSFDLCERVGGNVVRLCSQVTTATGEIAAGHGANRRAAPGILPAKELVWCPQVFREPLPHARCSSCFVSLETGKRKASKNECKASRLGVLWEDLFSVSTWSVSFFCGGQESCHNPFHMTPSDSECCVFSN